ncbi:hypothetical protein SMSP2_01406 [Limihaloglobus sulfuriphilus]|uniref:Uncharacterized protein n=1 Tax=Limihaloglobus sulfuriphilus TaxID=1851148 RepID=A0A1Q2MFL6_9BACT|nr:hypothetical protein [Limihaloglobus sulfuriphilus]AQQ71042.1 hypothetical protein SMSP2_01406 [Limihaloglobus sulfuriphilus]
MLKKVLLPTLVILSLTFTVAAQDIINATIVNDQFTDRERHTQDIPYSMHWFSRMAADSIFVNTEVPNYRLETLEAGVHQFWAHFTGQNYAIPNSIAVDPITLEVGETLKAIIRFQFLEPSDASFDRALMFGLFNSNETRDTGDGSGTGGERVDDTGYFVITNPGRTTDGYASIRKVTEGTSTDHFISYQLLDTFRSYNCQDLVTDMDIAVTRLDETTLSLSARVGPGYIITDVIDTPSDPDYFTFDTVSVFVDGLGFPDDDVAVSVDNVWVTYELYPDTCEQLMLFGGGYTADINEDCHVDIADFAMLADTWLSCNDPEDVNCN